MWYVQRAIIYIMVTIGGLYPDNLSTNELISIKDIQNKESKIQDSQNSYPFSLPSLPYSTSSLEPWIDRETMEIHWGKHHKTYVDNLNNACLQHAEFQNISIENIFARLNIPEIIKNNAGGHWNHSFFWKCMTDNSQRKKMPIHLQQIIQSSFGSLDEMKNEMERQGQARFGSGWVWLIQKNNGQLAILSTANQDNPLMKSSNVQGKPLLVIDVWEHAYYLKYKNSRSTFLSNFWNVVDWEAVAERLSST